LDLRKLVARWPVSSVALPSTLRMVEPATVIRPRSLPGARGGPTVCGVWQVRLGGGAAGSWAGLHPLWYAGGAVRDGGLLAAEGNAHVPTLTLQAE
jgi:hypothetical protein